MTILLVEQNASALELLRRLVAAIQPEAELLCFQDSLEALAAARQREIDVAFLETELPELNGLDLGQYLQELYPLINLIFLSDGADDAFDALSLHASGYILKPASDFLLRHELQDLRHPAAEKAHIEVKVSAPSKIEKVQIVKNTRLLSEMLVGKDCAEISFDDLTGGAAFYHCRVVLADGNLAVCSPVWLG